MFRWPSSISPWRLLDSERDVGAFGDDSHLARAVKALLDPLHLLRLGLPVEQHGAVEELRERVRVHAGVLRERRRRPLADHPRDLVRPRALDERQDRLAVERDPLRRHGAGLARVLWRVDRDVRVDLLRLVARDRCGRPEELVGRRLEPRLIVEAAP